jgi:hypothetical protein
MSRPRFLADHDLNDYIVTGVFRLEPLIEFRRAREADLARASDDQVLEFAAANPLLVVSHDVTTMTNAAYKRLKMGLPLSGLFLVEQTTPVAAVIDSLILIWSASELEEWQGRVQYLPL